MLAGASSGLSSNEIRNLRIKDFKKGYDPETEITTLKLTRGKVGFDFVTFFSPEASRAILEYLDYRERDAKAATPQREKQLNKQKILSDNGYLFIARNIHDEFLKTHNEELRKLSENALMKLYRSISEKAKKNTGKGFFNVIRSHTMRKYFNTVLLNAGCDSFHVEFFMGHTLDDTQAAYFRAKPEELKEIYKKYIPYLAIQKEIDVAASQEYLEIAKENDILRAETARHIVERKELSDMEIRLKRMAERQLKTDMLNIDLLLRSGSITKEDAELQKEILHIGFKIDMGEISDTEGNKLIEKLIGS